MPKRVTKNSNMAIRRVPRPKFLPQSHLDLMVAIDKMRYTKEELIARAKHAVGLLEKAERLNNAASSETNP